MSKELIRTSQYRTSRDKALAMEDVVFEAGSDTAAELTALYDGVF